MHEGRRRWVKGLKATGQKAPCGGDFAKSAKEKAERARLHEDLARKTNEVMFRANPALIAKAFNRLAEATMRLAEATHLEKLVSKRVQANGNGGGQPPTAYTPPRHPFIEGLLQTLPEPQDDWPATGRVKWLQTAANIFDLIHKGDGGIKIELAMAQRSPRPGET
jgi:hypothetical protein